MEKKLNWKEFSPQTKSDWEEAAIKMLKGKSMEDFLKWRSRSGFSVNSYCDSSDVVEKERLTTRVGGNSWIIRESFSGDAATQNKSMLAALNEGVNGLMINCSGLQAMELPVLFKGVLTEILDIRLEVNRQTDQWMKAFLDWNSSRGIANRSVRAAILHDYLDSKSGKEEVMKAAQLASAKGALVRVAHVDVSRLRNEGATAATELAVALSKGHEMLCDLMEAGLTVDQASALLEFSFSTGPDYLEEVAKYKVFRSLWKGIIEAYSPEHSCSTEAFVHAQSSSVQLSVNDAHNNLLRLSLQAMSAIIGGVDSLYIHPFDMKEKDAHRYGARWSRNIQFILRDESFLDKVADPAEGSWFIAELSEKLADQAWEKFRSIEDQGAYSRYLSSGSLQQDIEKEAAEFAAELKSGYRSWIGINKYPPSLKKEMDRLKESSKMAALEWELLEKEKEAKA